MKWVLYFFKKGWRTHFRLTCKQAWLEELLRFAALWLGKKTQTFSGTSQKPGQPRPCKTMLPGAHALKTFVPPFLPTQLTAPGSPTMISLRMRLQWYLVYSRPIPSNKIGERDVSPAPGFFFSEEGRICTGYYTDWRFYCFHWSLTNCWPPTEAWPQGFPRMISLKIRLHDRLTTAVPFPQTKSTRETSLSHRLSPQYFKRKSGSTQATTLIDGSIVFIDVWQIVDHQERPAKFG